MAKFREVLADAGQAYTKMFFDKAASIAVGPSKTSEVRYYYTVFIVICQITIKAWLWYNRVTY